MKARDLISFGLGAVLSASLVYGVLSYKHSLGPFKGDPGPLDGRNAKWAQPIASPRLRNFFKVSDALYRGAQPDRSGFLELEKLGIKTVVNLRLGGSDRAMLEGTAITPVEIPAEAWDLEDKDVVEFLRIVTDPGRIPVFVHCSHGADRTGAMVAIYRIAIQGWGKEEALQEMTTGGFGFHAIWDDLPKFIRASDIDRFKKLAASAQ